MALEVLQQLVQPSFTLNNENVTIDAKSKDTANILPDNILLHELQLGEQLNDSVVQARRADFSLMLAMLAEDVREQSQFVLPKPADQNYFTKTILQNSKLFRYWTSYAWNGKV